MGNSEYIQIKWLKRGIIRDLANTNEPKTVTRLIHRNEDRWNEIKLHELFEKS